ncbi:VOC family protein [Streptomyces sp. 8L]|uniref:VOC family protein n=1 Tax=Streptomyces sp. 8L TaxID=2877242 RepID=UPI001CD36213|nr:VOC family protein [Streptomyces sp. 8L]MCA1222680.1 VOC family protein [Streptomyces sp. 8L]
MAIATPRAIVLDAPDPVALAGFYAQIIGGEVISGEEDGWVDLEGAEGTRLSFQAAPGLVPPEWPSADKSQQLHLDFTVADLDDAERELLRIGAVALDTDAPGRDFRVYRDPAGHPFCLCVD